MKHPDPDAIRAMTAAVRALESRRPLRLNFNESRVFEQNCRTVGCLAGHFCLATAGESMRFNYGVVCHKESGNPVEFLESGNFLAHHLGMPGIDALEHWAFKNPDLWGSRRGSLLLRSPAAYPKPPAGTARSAVVKMVDFSHTPIVNHS